MFCATVPTRIISIWTRHNPDCPHSQNIHFRQCRCPKHLHWYHNIVNAEAEASRAPKKPVITPLDHYPLVKNDPEATKRAVDAFRRYFPAGRVKDTQPTSLKLPGEPGDAWEDDFVLIADAFTTGYHATGTIEIAPSDTVVVFGAGAVGLLAAYSALLRGAARVYVVDAVSERLEKAGELGAIPINFLHSDPVEQIREQQSKWRSGPAFRQESPLCGVTCAIDAIGFQARSKADYATENPLWVTEAIAELINPAGRVAIVGLWPATDPNGTLSSLKQGKITVPWSKLFNKNVRIALGRDDDQRWNRRLRDMVINGTAKASQIVSHRLPLNQAPVAFEKFDRREEGYVKVVLKPS